MRALSISSWLAAVTLASGSQIVLDANPTSAPSLDTLLVVERELSVFASYLRESKSLYGRILTPLGALNTTIMAPCDRAILSMHRKPHEGPEESSEVSSEDEEKRNAAYVELFVASHLVGGEIDSENVPKEVDTLADGRKIIFETSQEGQHGWQSAILQPGGAQIVSHLQASDGAILILDGVLDF